MASGYHHLYKLNGTDLNCFFHNHNKYYKVLVKAKMMLTKSSVHISQLTKQKNKNKIMATLAKLTNVNLCLKEGYQSIWLP